MARAIVHRARKRATMVALAAGLWIPVALPGCDNGQVRAETDLIGQGGGSSSVQGLRAIIERIQAAPEQIAFEGTRRVDRFAETPTVSYRERVAGDGEGGFQLEVLEVISAGLDTTTFRQTQAQTKGFQHRYGGFRIHDADKFQRNYQISILSKAEKVAGVDCHRWHIAKQDDGAQHLPIDQPNHFLVDFDPNTGLVLRWQEIDAFGNLVSKAEFETIQFGSPSLAMHQSRLTETPLSLDADLEAAAGFKVLRPKLLPRNFQLNQTSLVHDGQRRWIRQVFSDGVESLLLMHRAPFFTAGDTASTIGALVNGDRTVVMGTVNNVELIAEGKLSLDEMQDFVSSCF